MKDDGYQEYVFPPRSLWKARELFATGWRLEINCSSRGWMSGMTPDQFVEDGDIYRCYWGGGSYDAVFAGQFGAYTNNFLQDKKNKARMA
jgi:hypothetical protein